MFSTDMETKFLITLCLALSFCVEVNAESQQEVKRGLFPFMAFLYYPDESVVDGTGARFLRSAILIQPDWLITSAVGPSILNDSINGFPQKTLVARAGAISIDANFTLNEDEDEQEREIIQIVRPYNHSATQWWHTDIALMKTLTPFNLTSAVSVTMLVNKLEYLEKTCTILIYAKRDGNLTEDRNLMQLSVELLPPSSGNCGVHFVEKTMVCAADSEENKNAVYDPNFCLDNRGGPLICEGDVIGIQSYIEEDCKQPHLYQLLSAWDNFINCGTEEKCNEAQCSKVCDVVHKDPTEANMEITTLTTRKEMDTSKIPSSGNEVGTFDTTVETPVETSSDTDMRVNTMTSDTETTTAYETNTLSTTTEMPMATDLSTMEIVTEQVTEQGTDQTETTSSDETNEKLAWPREKTPSGESTEEQDSLKKSLRSPKVEAQQQQPTEQRKIVVNTKRSAGAATNVLNHSIIFGYFILARLM